LGGAIAVVTIADRLAKAAQITGTIATAKTSQGCKVSSL
jgi:hypothetical protein